MVKDSRGKSPNFVVGPRNLMTHIPTGLTVEILEHGPYGTYVDEVKAAHTKLMNRLRKGEHKKVNDGEVQQSGLQSSGKL